MLSWLQNFRASGKILEELALQKIFDDFNIYVRIILLKKCMIHIFIRSKIPHSISIHSPRSVNGFQIHPLYLPTVEIGVTSHLINWP